MRGSFDERTIPCHVPTADLVTALDDQPGGAKLEWSRSECREARPEGRITMALTTAQKNYLVGGTVAGVIGAILFGILAGNSSGSTQTAYISAAIACGIIAAICVIALRVKRVGSRPARQAG